MLCLHVGSSGTSPTTSADAPPEIPAVLFGAYGMYSAVDWLYSKIPVRFPEHQDLPVGRRHRLGRRDHRPPRPLLQVPTRLPADVARRRDHAERGAAPQLLVLRARRRRGHGAAPPHRRRPHPRRERLPARRLVVAEHAGDARAPAPRPGHPRRRGRAHHLAQRGRAVPSSRFRERRSRRVVAAQRARRSRRHRVRRGRVGRDDDVGASTTTRSSRMAGDADALRRRAIASRCRSPTARACTRRCSRCEKAGLVAVGIGARAGEREVAHLVERSGASHAADREPPAASAPGRRTADRPRRPLVPQLDVGHDRPAEDRDAQPGALVRVPRVRRPRRALHRRRRVLLARCPPRSASACGPRTSRPRSRARRASCSTRFDAGRRARARSSATASRCSRRCRRSS